MPLIVALLVVLAVLALSILLLPLAIVQRYRLGTRRTAARGWFVALNLGGVTISAVLFIMSAAIMSAWLPGAFTYAVAGLSFGCVVGWFGLAVTRWELAPGSLYYTPSRLLVLALTAIICARLLYGLWRGWLGWSSAADTASWLAASGAHGSLAAGAIVLGYYFVYWAGVRRRLARTQRVRRVRPRA